MGHKIHFNEFHGRNTLVTNDIKVKHKFYVKFYIDAEFRHKHLRYTNICGDNIAETTLLLETKFAKDGKLTIKELLCLESI